MLANLATSLFEHDQITTTEAKAKRLRPLAERLITFAKRGDLHARRRVMTVVKDKGVVHRLFTEIAPDMELRPGGYTRITKIGARKGDNAPMAVIELVREPMSAKKATVKEAEAATRRAAKDAEAPAAPTEVSQVSDAQIDESAAESEGGPQDQAPAAGDVGEYGEGSAPVNEDGSVPEGLPIKGNKDSMKYHEPDGQWFEQTVPEVWFATTEAAEAAGFTKAGA